MVDVNIDLGSFMIFIIFLSDSCMLGSILSFMMSNCSSDLLFALLPHFGILNLEVLRAASHK